MLFHSSIFAVFFLIFLAALPLFQGKARILYVIIASYLFYAWWYPPYALLLFGLTCLGYLIALFPRPPKWVFALMLAATLLPLGVFKYTNFILVNLHHLLGVDFGVTANWQLPLGISFVTFTLITYLVDVRRQTFPPEKDFSRFALYLCYFPHLIAGPIMRPRELLPQLRHILFRRKMVRLGLLLFAAGMLKKVVFADQIGILVDHFYEVQAPQDLARSLFAFYGFPIQIYCDFSGYTDMALGLSFVLGVRLPLNFNRPYAAVSVRDFWHRWHMTLSRWLRDYLYIPLGGSRHGTGRTACTLGVTMLLGGLWHGAAWTFVLWGGLHALFLIAEHAVNQFSSNRLRLPDWLRRIWTFHMVGVAWILFRAHGLGEMRHLLTGFTRPGDWAGIWPLVAFPVVLILASLVLHRWDRVSFVCWAAQKLPVPVVYGLAFVLVIVSKALSVGSPSAFIYFDF